MVGEYQARSDSGARCFLFPRADTPRKTQGLRQ
jgi:hypothetical protein